MSSLVLNPNQKANQLTIDQNDIYQIRQDIKSLVERIERQCQEHNTSPLKLPKPSQKAYGWLLYLNSKNDTTYTPLHQHLIALSLAYQYVKQAQKRSFVLSRRRNLTVRVTFYNITALYRTRIRKNDLDVVFHEGFIHAPEDIIEALVYTILGDKNPSNKTKFRTFALTKSFALTNQQLKLLHEQDNLSAQGKTYNLIPIFERVNQEFFDGMFAQPHLVWKNVHSKRNLASYHPDSNMLIFSRVLDNPKIPEFVIEFVMFHELLHKQIGTKIVNGRGYSHTKRFRYAEQAHPRYEDAEKVLKSLVNRR
jgi:hypothetical protein